MIRALVLLIAFMAVSILIGESSKTFTANYLTYLERGECRTTYAMKGMSWQDVYKICG